MKDDGNHVISLCWHLLVCRILLTVWLPWELYPREFYFIFCIWNTHECNLKVNFICISKIGMKNGNLQQTRGTNKHMETYLICFYTHGGLSQSEENIWGQGEKFSAKHTTDVKLRTCVPLVGTWTGAVVIVAISVKPFCWCHGHRRQHMGKVKSSRPSLQPM